MSYKSESFFTKMFVSTTDTFSSFLLDNPYLFNHVRFLLAGRQTGMKKFIKKHLKEYNCMSVADICSGTGDFAELVSKNSTYTGWDINDDFINYAKKKYAAHKNKQFVNANILKERL